MDRGKPPRERLPPRLLLAVREPRYQGAGGQGWKGALRIRGTAGAADPEGGARRGGSASGLPTKAAEGWMAAALP